MNTVQFEFYYDLDVYMANSTLDPMQSPLTLKNMSHHGTKVCILVYEESVSIVRRQEVMTCGMLVSVPNHLHIPANSAHGQVLY